MRTIRQAYFAFCTLFLAGGYAWSQWSYFTGNSAAYAKAVDSPNVQALSSLILVAGIGLYLASGSSGAEKP